MKYILTPFSGVKVYETGEMLLFGMTSETICKKTGEKINHKINTLEYFRNFRVDYDLNNLASAFEFFSNCSVFYNNDLYPLLCNKDLFDMEHREIVEIIKKYDPDHYYDSGIISYKLGIGTYVENDEEEKAESIILFKQDYYG